MQQITISHLTLVLTQDILPCAMDILPMLVMLIFKHHMSTFNVIKGTYIQGLHLENASWDSDKGCLKSSEIGELSVEFPVVAVVAVEKQPDQLTVSQVYTSCRIYFKLWTYLQLKAI